MRFGHPHEDLSAMSVIEKSKGGKREEAWEDWGIVKGKKEGTTDFRGLALLGDLKRAWVRGDWSKSEKGETQQS